MELSEKTKLRIKLRIAELTSRYGLAKSDKIVAYAWQLQNYLYSAMSHMPRDLVQDVARLAVANMSDAVDEVEKVLDTLDRQEEE